MGLYDFTVYGVFQRNAVVYGDNTAIISGSERITYRNLLERVDTLAGGLAAAGVEKGDRLAVISQNNSEFIYLFGAAAKIGAVLVLINWRLSPEEILPNWPEPIQTTKPVLSKAAASATLPAVQWLSHSNRRRSI